ncbi:MAG: hypothetical protein IJY08_03480 [Clostridia bacterium]|nr:hypothetical protein [Clostridia bacterium]
MKKRILVFLLCICLLLPMAGACNDTGDHPADTTDTQEAPSTEEIIGDPNLRLVSFNVRMDLNTTVLGTLDALSKNRVQAVREQILSYDPDVIGLQEDVQNWVDNINISGDVYARYIPDVKMDSSTHEYLSIYVKKGITVKAHGWKWLTSDGTNQTVAATYAELTDGDGYYDMDAFALMDIGIVNDAGLKTTYVDRNDNNKSYGNKLAARIMNYVVLEVNGKDVIYVNAHFQHRGYSEGEYTDHPLYMLRYCERGLQYEMVKAQIEELKKTYTDASVIMSGDFNDGSTSGFFKNVEKYLFDSMEIAKQGSKLEHSWNSAFDISKQGQGYVSDKENKLNGRIDFCVVSEELKNRVMLYQVGKVKWTLALAEGTQKQNVDVYPSDHLPVIVDFAIG